MFTYTITLTEIDYLRLSSLIERGYLPYSSLSELEVLEREVEGAKTLDSLETPPDLVTMNSRLSYLNITDNKFGEMTIVYPQHANLEEGKVSVTAPLGTALLGLRENDEISWTFPSGQTKTLRVLEILYQPEAFGDLHL